MKSNLDKTEKGKTEKLLKYLFPKAWAPESHVKVKAFLNDWRALTSSALNSNTMERVSCIGNLKSQEQLGKQP